MTFFFSKQVTTFHNNNNNNNKKNSINSMEKINTKSVVFYGVRKSFFHIFGVKKVLYINRERFFVFYQDPGGRGGGGEDVYGS